jgi:hypothetical protein
LLQIIDEERLSEIREAPVSKKRSLNWSPFPDNTNGCFIVALPDSLEYPNDAPDGNFDGYNFWVNKLNRFNGNYTNAAEMVKAFLSSIE